MKIKCKIALSITPDGRWEANGSESFDDLEGADHRDFFGGDRRPAGTMDYWIEVEVPVPEIPTLLTGFVPDPGNGITEIPGRR